MRIMLKASDIGESQLLARLVMQDKAFMQDYDIQASWVAGIALVEVEITSISIERHIVLMLKVLVEE